MPNTPNITALIADDEGVIRQYLKSQLQKYWPELTIVAEAEDGITASELIEQHQPNIVFLDIRMPGLTGMQVAERIKIDCQIIFITAYDEYALEAFDKSAIDYLLKPISEERLQKTIQRLKKKLENPNFSDHEKLLNQLSHLIRPTETRYLNWIKAAKGEDIRLIAVNEILYFESDEKYTSVFTATDVLLIRKPIKELEEELSPDQFWRVHRSIIVNVNHIRITRRDFAGRLWIEMQGTSKPLPVSRSYVHRFKIM